MNSKAHTLAFMTFMAAMQSHNTNFETHEEQKTTKAINNIKKIIPNGCKEYFFASTGEFHFIKTNTHRYIFDCIASNDKQAKRKFKNFVDALPVCQCKNGLQFSECITNCDRNHFEV